MTTYSISGTLLPRTATTDVAGLHVLLRDNAGVFNELLAIAVTDDEGRFEMRVDGADIAAALGGRDAVGCFEVVRFGRDLLADTRDRVTWRIDGPAPGRIRIPIGDAIGTLDGLPALHVTGRVYHVHDGPMSDVRVTLHDFWAASDGQQLGQVVLDENDRGRFVIAYEHASITAPKELANLRVTVEDVSTDEVLAVVERCRGQAYVVLNPVVGGAVYRGPTEYAAVSAAVEPVAPRGAVGDLDDEGVERVACLAARTVEEIRALRAAVVMKNDADLAGVTEEALYGLVRQQLPETKRELLAQAAPDLRAALAAAVTAHTIGHLDDDGLDAQVDGLVAAQVALAVDTDPDPATCNLGDVVKLYVSDAKARAFSERYSRSRGSLASFWDDLTLLPTDLEGLVVWLRADVDVFEDLGGMTPADDDSPVRLWRDHSGNANDATAGSDTAPTYRTSNATTGLPDVDVTTTGRFMELSLSEGSRDYTVMVRMVQAGSGARVVLSCDGSDPVAFAVEDDAGGMSVYDGDETWSGGAPAGDGDRVYTWVVDAEAQTLTTYANGRLLATVAYTGTGRLDGTTSLGRDAGDAAYLQSHLHEVVVYDRALSSDEIERMHQYLRFGDFVDFNAGEHDDLQRVLQWGTLTRHHLPLVQELQARHGTDFDTMRELATWGETEWLAAINGTLGDGTVPTDMPGADITEQRANYAKVLARTMELAIPTGFIEGRVKDDEGTASDLYRFLSQNHEFELGKTRVAHFLADAPDLTDVEDLDALSTRLKGVERIFKVTPYYAEMKVLLDAGLTSARAIQRLGKAELVAAHGTALGGADIVEEIHARSVQQAEIALGLWSLFSADVAGPPLAALPSYFSPAAPTDPKLASWQALFGGLDLCICKHCRSVYSAAAYLVELLERLGYHSPAAKLALLAPNKRADIARILLSCDNTNTALPYIDLVIELLERLVSGKTPPEHISTTGTTPELLAAPEILDPVAFDLAYDTLAGAGSLQDSALYPWALPYAQGQHQARVYTEHLGVERHRLMRLFQTPEPFPTDLQIAQERVGLNELGRRLVTADYPAGVESWQLWGFAGATPGPSSEPWWDWLHEAAVFVPRAELSYEKLKELLDTEIVRRHMPFTEPRLLRHAGTDGCQLEELRIAPFEAPEDAWDAVQRFLRLRLRLGWSIADLDVAHGLATSLDDDFLERLADVLELRQRLRMPLDELVGWWSALRTRDMPSIERPSIYTKLFLDRGLETPEGDAFLRPVRIPTELRGCVLWLRADRVEIDGSSNVEIWTDLSGAGHLVTQATAGDRPGPVSNEASIGGKPAIAFAPGKTLDHPFLSANASDYTVFWVGVTGANESDAHYLTASVVEGPGLAIYADGTPNDVGYKVGAADKRVVAKLDDRAQLLAWRLDASRNRGEVFRDGAKLGQDAWSKIPWPGGTLGGGDHTATHKWAEVIVFNRVLSDAEMTRVHGYLLERYELAFTPRSIAGCESWLDTDLADIDDRGRVNAWPDGAGTGALDPGESARPDYVESVELRQRVLDLDGVTQHLRFDLTTSSVDFTFACRIHLRDTYPATTASVVSSHYDTGKHWRLGVSNGDYAVLTEATVLSATAEAQLGPQTLVLTADSAVPGVELFKDGVLILDDAWVPSAAAFGGSGNLFRDVAGEDHIDLRSGDIAVYRRALTLYERGALERYLREREPTIARHAAHVRAAIRASAADHELLTSAVATHALLRLPPPAPEGALHLESLSRLARLTSLPRALRLRASELVALQAMSGLKALAGDLGEGEASPAETLAFVEIHEKLRDAGLRIPMVHYLLRHVVQPGTGVSAETTAIATRLSQLDTGLAKIVADTTPSPAPDGATIRALLVEILAAEAPDLPQAEVQADADAVVAIVEGTSILDDAEQRAALSAILGPYVDDPEALADVLVFRPYELDDCELWLEPRTIVQDGGLVSAWTSLAGSVTVRPPNPLDIADCVLWLVADGDDVTLAGDDVSGWTDRSPASHDASTGGNRPLFAPAGWSTGLPVVSFDRANSEWLSLGAPGETATSYTVFGALAQRGADDDVQSLLFATGAGDFGLAIAVTPDDAVGGYDGAAFQSIAPALDGEQLLIWEWNAAEDTFTCYRNGALLGSVAYTGALTLGSNAALGSNESSSPGSFLDADLAEVIVYGRALEGGERNLVHGYVASRLALSGPSSPRFEEAGPFGLSAVRFDGEKDMLVVEHPGYLSTSHTFVCVVHQSEHHIGGAAVLDVESGRLVLAADTAADPPSLGLFDGTSWTALGDGRTGDQILTWRLDATHAEVTAYRDGLALLGPVTYDSPQALGGAVGLGGRVGNGVGPFDGLIACAGLFSRALSDDELARVHDYLNVLAGKPPAERFALVERPLLEHKRQRDARGFVQQSLSTALGIEAGIATTLLTEWLEAFSVKDASLIADLMPETLAAPGVAASAGDRARAITRFSKAAFLVRQLDLDDETLAWIHGEHLDPGWYDFNALPVEPTVFDADTATVRDGVISLPAWLTITCATEDRTARIGTSAVRSDLGADAARAARLDDEEGWALLVEPATTNLITSHDLRSWSLSSADGEIVVSTAPDGSTAYLELSDMSEGQAADLALTMSPGVQTGWRTTSLWLWLLAPTPTQGGAQMLVSGQTPSVDIVVTALDDDWTFRAESAEVTVAGDPSFVQLWSRNEPVDTGAARFWGMQIEGRRYPTSFIAESRAADVLSIADPTVVTRGDHYFDVTIVYAPGYAHDETAGDHDLIFIDANHRLFFRASDQRIVLRLGGIDLVSEPLEFDRDVELTIRAAHLPSWCQLEVAGAADGNGWTGAPPRAPMPALNDPIYVLGDDTGTQEAARLRRLAWDGHDLDGARERFAALMRLIDLASVRGAFRAGEGSLFTVLAQAFGGAPRSIFLDAVSAETGWRHDDLGHLVGEHGFDFAYPDDFADEYTWVRLRDAFASLQRLGASALDVLGTKQNRTQGWLDVDELASSSRETGAELLRLARAKHSAETWPEIGRALRDELRIAQRDALLAYVLNDKGLESPDALYAELLVDAEMSPCQLTSRIKQAIGSVQTYYQRLLLGLEPLTLGEDAAAEWEWLKSYRIWEANRKVFLYPENWVEPEWRDVKSELFEKAEAELNQNEVTDELAERVYIRYLEGLDEISKLEVASVVRQPLETAIIKPRSRLHVLARTLDGDTSRYFYRTLEPTKIWTPWRTLETEFEGSHPLLHVHDNRVYLFSAAYQHADEDPETGASAYVEARIGRSELTGDGFSGTTIAGKGWGRFAASGLLEEYGKNVIPAHFETVEESWNHPASPPPNHLNPAIPSAFNQVWVAEQEVDLLKLWFDIRSPAFLNLLVAEPGHLAVALQGAFFDGALPAAFHAWSFLISDCRASLLPDSIYPAERYDQIQVTGPRRTLLHNQLFRQFILEDQPTSLSLHLDEGWNDVLGTTPFGPFAVSTELLVPPPGEDPREIREFFYHDHRSVFYAHRPLPHGITNPGAWGVSPGTIALTTEGGILRFEAGTAEKVIDWNGGYLHSIFLPFKV
jgi:hypothetical protein